MIKISLRTLSSISAGITRPHRLTYTRTYPTTLVYPDGSTITIRYSEPRQIIKLPLDLSTLSEEARKARLDSRKPKQKVKYVDDLEDSYNNKKYMKYFNKEKKQ